MEKNVMTYNEFKHVICVQCGKNCAAGSGCDFSGAYNDVYLWLWNKIDALAAKRDRLLHLAEIEDKTYEYRQQRWPAPGDDYELRIAARYRAKAASLQLEIDAKRKEIVDFITLEK